MHGRGLRVTVMESPARCFNASRASCARFLCCCADSRSTGLASSSPAGTQTCHIKKKMMEKRIWTNLHAIAWCEARPHDKIKPNAAFWHGWIQTEVSQGLHIVRSVALCKYDSLILWQHWECENFSFSTCTSVNFYHRSGSQSIGTLY